MPPENGRSASVQRSPDGVLLGIKPRDDSLATHPLPTRYLVGEVLKLSLFVSGDSARREFRFSQDGVSFLKRLAGHPGSI
jgi:hypothetical protein